MNQGGSGSDAHPRQTRPDSEMRTILRKSVYQMLRPLIRVLIRHGISHSEFSGWARHVYVNEAANDPSLDKPPSQSHIAIVTGINRKEVRKLLEAPLDADPGPAKFNRATRVVTGWLQDSEFQNRDGNPAALAYGTDDAPFNRLVKRYGGDVPARAVLNELLRSGTIAKKADNLFSLIEHAYVPQKSPEEMLTLFGQHSTDLLNTLDYNLDPAHHDKRLQLSVVYDNVPEEALETFRSLSSDKALALLKELDKHLSQQDRDVNPSVTGSDRYRAGLGVYLIQDRQRSEENED